MRFPFLLLMPIILTGCFTAYITDKAEIDHRPQKVRNIRDAWADTAGNVIVNFEGKLSGSKRNAPAHMVVPVRRVINDFSPAISNKKYIEKKDSLPGIKMVSQLQEPNSDSIYNATEILLEQQMVLEGFYTPTDTDTLISQQFRLSVKPTDYKWSRINIPVSPERLVLLYHPGTPPQGPAFGGSDIVISVEPSPKKRFRWYLLMPVTVAADIATFPVQLIVAGVALYLYYKEKDK